MRCGGKWGRNPLIAFQDAPPCKPGNSLRQDLLENRFIEILKLNRELLFDSAIFV